MRRSMWPILVGATFGLFGAHWLIVLGVLFEEGDASTAVHVPLTVLGLMALAVTATTASIASGHDAGAALAATSIGGAVLGVAWLVTDPSVPIIAIVAGSSVAAALGVRRLPHQLLWVRFLMVAVVVGYTWWVTTFSAAFAVVVTPLLPYPTVGVADYASDREAERRPRASYAPPR